MSRPDSPEVDEAMDELQQHGINVQDILKLKVLWISTFKYYSSYDTSLHICNLKSAALNTISGVNMTPKRQLLKVKGLSEAKVEKIKEAVRKVMGSSFATGLEVQDKRRRVLLISTGSKSVDAMLGGDYFYCRNPPTIVSLYIFQGGIMSQSISEVYGEFRTGKTQLAHTMSVVAQLPPELGGASGKRGPSDRIELARAFNSEHQMELINECSSRFAEDKDFRLLVGYFFLFERKIADPGATMTFIPGGALKPIGGHILSHASATRIYLRKGRAEERVAKLVDSPDRPESEASYKLDEGGWADV
ncbi:family atpase dmc1 [Pyrrhoderma noxium]|uniref:Family atpase dmc1 n=1 Tax=Pyrrhoderma noxium TaxID=2282107 RepID=A0A286USH3_9AGAM|nr:family atpase dmc1 [Pyrrhoderma noxium]